MKFISSLLLSFTVVSFSPIHATPSDDLSSPDQSVRDKAAAVLRVSFQSIPESKWLPLLDKLKNGLSYKEVRAILLPYNVTEGGGAGGGGAYTNSFRLDKEWAIVCAFTYKDHILFNRELAHALERVEVTTPKDFTGRWVTYFTNGNLSREVNYKNGKRIGTSTSYMLDGSKCIEEHYHENGIDLDQIGFYPSGNVSYRMQIREGKLVGIPTQYDEVARIISTSEPAN